MTGTGDSSPMTEAGTRELGLRSVGHEWIVTPHLSGRNYSQGRERASPTFRGWIPGRQSQAQRLSEMEGALEMISILISQPRILRPDREKGLSEVPQGISSGPRISLGLLTPSLVQVTHNDTKNYIRINSHNSSYERTEASHISLKSHSGSLL